MHYDRTIPGMGPALEKLHQNFRKNLSESPLKPGLPNLYLHNKYNLQRASGHTKTTFKAKINPKKSKTNPRIAK